MDVSEIIDSILPKGWTHNADTFGEDFTLVCPCGIEIEQDGTCPNGHVSPLREQGLI